MDCIDMQRFLNVFLLFVLCTYSHHSSFGSATSLRPKLDVAKLDRKYQQKLINRIGFHPVFHNKSYIEKIRSSLPQPIARRIHMRNAMHPTEPPPFNREFMIVGQHLPRCISGMTSACFVLRVSDDLRLLKEATLWIDLQVDDVFAGHTIAINEIRYVNNNVQVRERIGDQIQLPTTSRKQTQSVVRDMTGIMKRWARQARARSNNVFSRAIAISCTDCGFEGVSPVLDDRVILEISLYPRTRRSKRSRRGNNYSVRNLCGTIPIFCCLQQYTLNFQRVGWDSWVVFPPEFSPNYCMGSCEGNILPQTQHASMIAAAVQHMGNLSPRQRNAMLPCCAPTSMGSFTLMYLDPLGKVRLNQMNNLVAFDCGCM